MELLQDSFGHSSSKRVAGLMLILTVCLGTFQVISFHITGYETLLIGIATIGAGLLGSTMVERKLKKV